MPGEVPARTPGSPSARDARVPLALREHHVEIPADPAGCRLDVALATALPQYSRSQLQGWMKAGAVLLDGRAARPRDAVYGGERVTVVASFIADESVGAEAIPLDIVHADEGLIIVNKPAGLVVHPGAGNRAHTLQNALLAFDPTLARLPRAGLVHRIDKDTSGLLAVARTPEAHVVLTRRLRDREIGRQYLAVCVGVPLGAGTIDEPIGRHRTQRLRMTVRGDGRVAITHYRVEQRYRAHALLRVELDTGRTHQIRVHLAHVGYPLVGDPLYGGRRQSVAGISDALRAHLAQFARQALHAARLELLHPLTDAPLQWEAPPPADFTALLAALGRDASGEADEPPPRGQRTRR